MFSFILICSLFTVSFSAIGETIPEPDCGNDPTCDVCLFQEDFEYCPPIISEPNQKICIGEDIKTSFFEAEEIFKSPNSNDLGTTINWFPYDNKKLFVGSDILKNGPFALGFFASLIINASNIIVDLKGHEIAMSRAFFIQQRWHSIIEIGASPFIPGQGPNKFGPCKKIKNIVVQNGKLGLSSHHGIHSNEATNVVVKNVQIYNFEVAGIQFNGFNGVNINNVEIGPSITNLPVSSYYSAGRFILKAMQFVDFGGLRDSDAEVGFFKGDLTYKDVYENLRESLDIVFRHIFGKETKKDKRNPLRQSALDLFINKQGIPDGSSIFGIIFHNKGVSVNGFGTHGNGKNVAATYGRNVIIEDVCIHDLRLNVNEVPSVFFDKCIDPKTPNSKAKIVKGPFGDVLDLRKVFSKVLQKEIDLGNFKKIRSSPYVGNALSDAIIALGVYENGEFCYGSNVPKQPQLLDWVMLNDPLPECTSFICNGDVMFHTNKGAVALRFDGIQNVKIKNTEIRNIINESPLSTMACNNYTGPHDGGNPSQLDKEGTMTTDVRGVSLIDSDVTLIGKENKITNLYSYNGDVTGVHVLDKGNLLFKRKRNMFDIESIEAGLDVTERIYRRLVKLGKTPFPNNFLTCDIIVEKKGLINSKPSKSINCEDLSFVNQDKCQKKVNDKGGVTDKVNGRGNPFAYAHSNNAAIDSETSHKFNPLNGKYSVIMISIISAILIIGVLYAMFYKRSTTTFEEKTYKTVQSNTSSVDDNDEYVDEEDNEPAIVH